MASCKVNDEPRSLESIGGCKGEVVRAGLREKEESGGYQLRRAGRGPHLLAAERRTSHCLSQPYEPHRRPERGWMVGDEIIYGEGQDRRGQIRALPTGTYQGQSDEEHCTGRQQPWARVIGPVGWLGGGGGTNKYGAQR
ncbi:hypothetical protein Pcinc_033563 [Petrolisthes cinctipes]|uniref:Uncharacterized protein n=1 Tax=Petrolisthes cinctipes TaxID=88211 RepID=A0AAE1K159_PETCI|nr:hypothetical protein Pcinc_033563 [Petrolisthes cinctipes]